MRVSAFFTMFFVLLLSQSATSQSKAPGIVFSTLLNEVQLAYEKGVLRIDYLTAMNLPGADDESNGPSAFQYTPKGTPGLSTIIKLSGYDEEFATLYWTGTKNIEPFWTLANYETKQSKAQSGENQPKLDKGMIECKTTGSFAMEFYLDDKLFYSFPFSISRLPGVADGDPIDKYFLDGPWEEYCQLFYVGGMPNMNIKLVMWLRNKDRRPTKNVQFLGILMKDGAPVAKTSEGQQELVLTPEWQRFEFPLGTSERSEAGQLVFKGLRAQNILKAPGGYELMVTVDNKLYGMYEFAVESGGTFRLIREQDPEQTPATILLHGGNDTIWLKRKK